MELKWVLTYIYRYDTHNILNSHSMATYEFSRTLGLPLL